MFLERIEGPETLRSWIPLSYLNSADEIRKYITDTVSHTGGHLSSNLGVVELTLASTISSTPPGTRSYGRGPSELHPQR